MRSIKKSRFVGVLILLSLVEACSSSGGGSTTLEPTLASIQTNIFSKKCALPACHNDGSAQGDLKLTTGNSFSQLVAVPANINPLKYRVVPGDPDGSLLIQKLEGPADGDGVQMPKGRTPLDQSQIDVIRQWITDGALENADATPVPTATPDPNATPTPTPTPATPQIKSKVPASGATGISINTKITVTFDRAMDAATFTNSTFHADVSSVAVAATITHPTTKSVTLAPATFTLNDVVTVHLTTGVKDATGAVLASAVSWSFTADTGPDVLPPTFGDISSATNNGNGTATLAWTAATDDHTAAASITYLIYEAADSFTAPVASVVGTTSYTTPVQAVGSYQYRVTAMDGAGNETAANPTNDKTVSVTGPTFTQVYAMLTSSSHTCTGSTCHDSVTPQPNNPGPGMDLSTKALAYSNTVGVTSTENSPMKRILAGDPDNSYLYNKLAGTGLATGTVQMPKSKTKLNSDELSTVRFWILGGALNN